MKNLLIPSTLELDTINAVKVAIQQSKGKQCTLTLALVSEIPDTYSTATFLRSMKSELSASQKNVLEYCRELVTISQNCTLKIHYQYGISTPLVKNLIEHLGIELTILTPSYRNTEKRIHNQFVQILCNCKNPILHLSSNFEEQQLSKAMYLEQTKSKIQLEDLQELIPDHFSFKIVSQAKIFNDQNTEDLELLLNDAITKNNIDLLIETRKPKKIKLKKENIHTTENFGLPILSLYEEIV
ncbi:hypothetical protein ACSV4D_00990 [Flavobacterium sp. ARAG 55.4]|uniref:Universal stress protein family protein n=1 Tax=Flavobacterium plantiphilum TaxID=3163297 RepID=A0ABW8XRJ9_9FLAO